MADREEEDWTTGDTTRRRPRDSCGDDVETEEDYDDDYDDDEDYDNDDDGAKNGLACPFCFEDFDVLGLFCHIDVVHHREAKAAICPVCVTKVDINIVAHLIAQHKTILKMLCKRKIHKGGSHSSLLILKESQDERFHSHLKGSSGVDSSSSTEPDSVLVSFVHNRQTLRKPEITRPSTEASSRRSNSDNDTLEERYVKTCALPNKDQERVQRCEFVHGLLFSTIFNDDI